MAAVPDVVKDGLRGKAAVEASKEPGRVLRGSIGTGDASHAPDLEFPPTGRTCLL